MPHDDFSGYCFYVNVFAHESFRKSVCLNMRKLPELNILLFVRFFFPLRKLPLKIFWQCAERASRQTRHHVPCVGRPRVPPPIYNFCHLRNALNTRKHRNLSLPLSLPPPYGSAGPPSFTQFPGAHPPPKLYLYNAISFGAFGSARQRERNGDNYSDRMAWTDAGVEERRG